MLKSLPASLVVMLFVGTWFVMTAAGAFMYTDGASTGGRTELALIVKPDAVVMMLTGMVD